MTEKQRALEAVQRLPDDATVEKLGELLNENPHGLLQFRDEDAGFLHMMDREGHENARAFLKEHPEMAAEIEEKLRTMAPALARPSAGGDEG